LVDEQGCCLRMASALAAGAALCSNSPHGVATFIIASSALLLVMAGRDKCAYTMRQHQSRGRRLQLMQQYIDQYCTSCDNITVGMFCHSHAE